MIGLNTSKQDELLQVLKKNERKLRRFDGVYDVGIGYIQSEGKMNYEKIGILVFVVKKFDTSELETKQLIPREIDGVRVDVIETNPVQQNDSPQQNDPNSLYDKLLGGITISNIKLTGGGTLGLIVKDKEEGIPLGLTNHHVIKRTRGRRGNAIVQPEKKPNNRKFRIGKLYRWDTRLDCAVFKVKRRAIDTRNSFLNIDGKVKGLADPLLGMEVKKAGVTTGVTYGVISAVSSDLVRIRISSNPKKWVSYNEISLPGDSGSVWVTDEENMRAVGLHHSGDSVDTPLTEYAIANGMKAIFKRLDLALWE